MARLYANENFPAPVVLELRRLGHDVVTIQERGRANESASDSDVLEWAIAEGRAVLTLNRRDFIRMNGARPNHEGIVVCTVDADFLGQAQRIHRQISGRQSLHGQLVRVNRP